MKTVRPERSLGTYIAVGSGFPLMSYGVTATFSIPVYVFLLSNTVPR